MRVGIDARFLSLPGVGRYTRCLLRALSQHAGAAEFVVYVRSVTPDVPEGLRQVVVGGSPYSPLEHFIWPVRLKRDGIDVFHTPHFAVPFAAGIPMVVTLHDMVYFRYPPSGSVKQWATRKYYWTANQIASRRASGIVTASEYSRTEIVELLNIPRDRVHVVPHAADPNLAPASEAEISAIRAKLALHGRYLLYVGTNKPWKNLSTVLSAFARMMGEHLDLQFVIAGKRARNEEDVFITVDRSGIPLGRVVVAGELSDAELAALYSASNVVVCPSQYEGFGLTLLEALACGAPLVASSAASHPEVVGDAALLVSPTSVTEWVEAIGSVLTNPQLKFELSRRGPAQARHFTLNRLATDTLAVYSHVSTH